MNRIKSDRLVRTNDGLVAGVCSGIARRFGVSTLVVRLVWLASVLFAGTGILLYLVLWWLMPHERNLPLEPAAWIRDQGGTHHPPLARTEIDRKLFGVCGGLARRYGLDPTLVRVGVLALATVSLGLVVVAYLLAALLLPSAQASTVHPPITV